MNRKAYIIVGVISVIVGVVQLYQSILDRPAGASVPVFGLVTGLVFVGMGLWFCTRGARQP